MLRRWALVVGLALAVALLLRTFVAEAFRIPTSSMEDNLRVGDYLLVSKLHYGPRTPVTLGVPFTDVYLTELELPPRRLPGFETVRRGDVVVFNHPPERAPLDRKTPYIKRVVGLPGDTVRIVGKELRVNGAAVPAPPEMQHRWRVTVQPEARLTAAELGAVVDGEAEWVRDAEWEVAATRAEAEALRRHAGVLRVEPVVAERPEWLFPAVRPQTLDDYGPVIVPGRGATVRLTAETWPALRDVITRYEGHTARRLRSGAFEIDGAVTDTYTFEQDYYFVLGDNRDDSSDSRRWGFVPRDHLVGKAVLVYFSWDPERRRPRLDRLFHRIR